MNTKLYFKGTLTLLVFSAIAAGGANADIPALTVSGNQILSNGKANSFSVNGLFLSDASWNQERAHNASAVKWLNDSSNSTIARIAPCVDGDGSYLNDPEGNVERIETAVETAIANDMYAIIDFQTCHAEDYKAEAIAFFEQMALTYGSYDNVIYEIYNEPSQVSWDKVIKPYAEDVISAIRSIDVDNLIVVGTSNWSQDVDVASQNPIMGDNIAYALHFYPDANWNSLRDKALTALDNGIPVMLSMWSTLGTNSDEGTSIMKSSASLAEYRTTSDSTTSGSYIRKALSTWNFSNEKPFDSMASTSSGELTINLINISDLIDVAVDVEVDADNLISTVNDVAVDVGVDIDNLINSGELDDMADNVVSDDLIDAVDQVLSYDLYALVDEILNGDLTDVADQISSSDLYDAANQLDLGSQFYRLGNSSSRSLGDESVSE
jgi:hypothetical protein